MLRSINMKNKEIRESYSTIQFPCFKLPCTTAFKLEMRLLNLENLVVRPSVKSRLCLLARKKRQPFKYSVYIITTIFESIEFKKNFK